MKTCLMTLGTVYFSCLAFGYDWPSQSGCVVQTEADTGSANSSIVNTNHWTPQVLDGEHDYWVPAEMTIYGTSSDNTFVGKSLTLGGKMMGLNANITFSHLRLLGGSNVIIDKNKDGLIGEITVESTEANPATIWLGRSGSVVTRPRFTSTSSFLSDKSSYLDFRHTAAEPKQYLFFNGCDLSGFYGSLRVSRSQPGAGIWFTNSIQGTIVMPGSYRVGDGVLLLRNANSATLQVGDLTLDAGSRIANRLNVGDNPAVFVTVTNRFAAADADVEFLNFTESTLDTPQSSRPIVKLTGAAASAEDLPDATAFRLVNGASLTNNFWGAEQFGYDKDGDDKILAYRDARPIVQYVGNSSTKVATDASNWDGNEFPTKSQNGYVEKGYFCVDTSVSDDYSFPGGGLVFKTGYIRPDCATMAIPNLFIAAGGTLTVELYKNITTAHAAVWQDLSYPTVITCNYLGVYGELGVSLTYGREAVVNAPLYGAGDVTASTRYKSDYPYGGAEFAGINTNWFGKFTAHNDCSPDGKQTNAVNGTCFRLYLSDARNVGGALDAFTFDAFRLRGNGLVIGRNSLTFDQANRGIFIEDRMRFVMTNETSNTLAIDNTVTFGGELVFGNEYPTASRAPVGKGGGLLRLGGAAKFYDKANGQVVDSPVDAAARLTMLIGKLQVSATNALDGVVVTFGEESEGLVVDWEGSDEMKARGLVNVKASEPFVTARKDGHIPVSVVNYEAKLQDAGKRVAVCTVATAKAAAVAGLLKPVRPQEGVHMTVGTQDNGDGTTTVYLEAGASRGLTVIFR